MRVTMKSLILFSILSVSLSSFVFAAEKAGSNRDWEKTAIELIKKTHPEYNEYSFFTSALRSPFQEVRLVKVVLDRFPGEKVWMVAEANHQYQLLHCEHLEDFLKDIEGFGPITPSKGSLTEKEAQEWVRSALTVFSPGVHHASCTREGDQFSCVDQQIVTPANTHKFRLVVSKDRKLKALEQP
jgi:hypothetical protein